MILTCPNCGTQYVVKDGAIPPEGRQVRCAACKHSWHQEPDDANEAAVESMPSAQLQPATDMTRSEVETEDRPAAGESLAEASLIEPRSGPEAEQRAYEEAIIEGEADSPSGEGAPEPANEVASADELEAPVSIPRPGASAQSAELADEPADWNEPPMAEAAPDQFSPFVDHDEVELRRRSPLLTFLVILVVVIAAAALFWFVAPPSLKAKLGITTSGATPLQLVTTHMDRTPLESGNELLTVTGRVINPSAKEQDVPPIQAQLKNRSGKVVYSWTIQPPAHTLPAGASASFNSAEVNVPPGADELTITLGGPQA